MDDGGVVMKTVACLSLFCSVVAVGCAAGTTAPDGPLNESVDAGSAAPVVLAPNGSDAAATPTSTGFPGNGNTGTSGGSGDAGAAQASSASGGSDASSVVTVSGLGDAGGFTSFDAGSASSGSSGFDAGSPSSSGSTCQGYADPNTSGGCTCAASDPSECQANGCYGGYWCDTVTNKCHANPPSGC